MYVSDFGGFGRYGFGSMSPVTGGSCPVEGTSETSWCDCMWPADRDATTNAKCKAPGIGAPWTVTGAFTRGIPKAGEGGITLPSGSAAGTSTTLPSASTKKGIFGIPTTALIWGGAIIGLGIGGSLIYAAVRRKKKAASSPGVSGYARYGRKHNRSRRKH